MRDVRTIATLVVLMLAASALVHFAFWALGIGQ